MTRTRELFTTTFLDYTSESNKHKHSSTTANFDLQHLSENTAYKGKDAHVIHTSTDHSQ